jgi:hypothetical protein
MKLISNIKFIPVAIIGLALGACAATGDYVSDLYKPNFGRLELNSDENVDARLLMNGLYSSTPHEISPYTASCATASFRCLQRAQSSWSSFDP